MSNRREAPHVLYVAWGYPPCRAGGVYRALATANAFAAAGWRVTVLTAEREAFEKYTGSDPTMEDRIDPAIEVVRLPFFWPHLEADIRGYPWLRVYLPKLWRRYRNHRDTLAFPEPGYGPWRAVLERAAERIHAKDPVDLVIATANPNVDFTAAALLHAKHGVPYVMDYRDAWLLDVFDGGMLHEEGSRAARWEKRLIGAAREVWFVNEPIRAWHQARYPDRAERMHVVANGFDPEFAPPARHHCPEPGQPLTFGYLGTITPKVPLAALIAGWRWARGQDGDVRRSRLRLHGYLGYYAGPRQDLKEMIADAADTDLAWAGPVGKSEIAGVYESFDVLLLVLGAGAYVTSGKVFEYIATGMPIVSVHDPGNAASDVLRAHPLWFPAADLTPRGIGRAIIAATKAALSADDATRDACRAFAAAYSRALQLAPRVASLTASVGGVPPAAATPADQAHPEDQSPPQDQAPSELEPEEAR